MLTAVIARNGAQITFTYDNTTGEASVLYPSDTRMEDKKQDTDGKDDLLPDFLLTFGTAMPSMEPVVNMSPKKAALEDGGTRYTYSGVTEAQYDAFSRYLAAYGCALEAFEAQDGVATASVSRKNAAFSFTYDSHALTAEIDYPSFSFVEDMEALAESTEALLPLADEAFGVLMPRIALATGLESGGLVETENGYEETYANFTDADYAQFSAYLQENNCTVADYSTDASGAMTINLVKSDVPFTFIYDRAGKHATVRYAANSRPEYTPMPTPSPTPAPTKEVEPSTTKESGFYLYSESECWRTAEAYFKSMSWKNPDSLTIHSYTTTKSDGSYTFRIDYSAQNGFGGYNRDTGMVVVDAGTNKVTLAWAG